MFRLDLEPEGAAEKLAALVEQALPVFEAAGDDLALYVAYSALAAGGEACARRWTRRWRRTSGPSPTHGARAYVPPSITGTRAGCRFFGTTPVSELLAWLDENEPQAGRDQFFRAYRGWRWRCSVASTRRARSSPRPAQSRPSAAEESCSRTSTRFESVWVELLAGDPAAAAEFGAEGCRLHEELGKRATFLSTRRVARRRRSTRSAGSTRPRPGPAAQRSSARATTRWMEMLWRQVRAKVLARRGEHAEAERLAREAVAIGDDTDLLDAQGDAYADLAEVLLLAGKPDEAAAALEQALERYERKGNLVSAQRMRTRLDELAGPRDDA